LHFTYMQACRKWGGRGALAPPVFGQTVNPISTRGADYAHHSTTSPPRIFKPCDGPDMLSDFPGTKNLSGLNDVHSLISSKQLYFKVKIYIFDG
jgi:hypothetical protein